MWPGHNDRADSIPPAAKDPRHKRDQNKVKSMDATTILKVIAESIHRHPGIDIQHLPQGHFCPRRKKVPQGLGVGRCQHIYIFIYLFIYFFYFIFICFYVFIHIFSFIFIYSCVFIFIYLFVFIYLFLFICLFI